MIDRLIAVFDPLMRETLELGRLNRIWEHYNEHHDKEYTQKALLRERWKYHTDRAYLLLTLTNLITPLD